MDNIPYAKRANDAVEEEKSSRSSWLVIERAVTS